MNLLKTSIAVMVIILYTTMFGEGSSIQETQKQSEAITTTQAVEVITKEPEIKKIKLTFTGDLMCHRWQLEGAHKDDGSYDFGPSFAPVKKYLERADLTIGNFETTMAGEETAYRYYPTFNSPDSYGEAVKDAGFDIVMTANNHSLDSGVKGVKRTIEILDKLGIEHTGSYITEEESKNIYYKEMNGFKIAVLNYTYGTNGIKLPTASEFMLNYIDTAKIKGDILKAKVGNPDIIILFVHFGNEYEEMPAKSQKKIRDIAYENGVDLLIGSHPHVLQPFEIVEEREGKKSFFAAYSLGNFISSQRTKPRDAGVILDIELSKKEGKNLSIDEIDFIPTWVQAAKRKDGTYDMNVNSVEDALADSGSKFDRDEKERLEEIENFVPWHLTGKDELAQYETGEYIYYRKGE